MIPCLDIVILSNDIPTLNAIMLKAPSKLDSGVWCGVLDEYTLNLGTNIEGIPCLIVSIKFDSVEGRQIVWSRIEKAMTQTVLNKILTGSYANFHDCNHDEDPKYRITGCGNVTPVWSK